MKNTLAPLLVAALALQGCAKKADHTNEIIETRLQPEAKEIPPHVLAECKETGEKIMKYLKGVVNEGKARGIPVQLLKAGLAASEDDIQASTSQMIAACLTLKLGQAFTCKPNGQERFCEPDTVRLSINSKPETLTMLSNLKFVFTTGPAPKDVLDICGKNGSDAFSLLDAEAQAATHDAKMHSLFLRIAATISSVQSCVSILQGERHHCSAEKNTGKPEFGAQCNPIRTGTQEG